MISEIIVPNLKVQVDDKVSCGQMMKRHNPGDVTEFTCPKNTYGHSLTITKNSGYWGDILWLCEVQVYGAGKGKYLLSLSVYVCVLLFVCCVCVWVCTCACVSIVCVCVCVCVFLSFIMEKWHRMCQISVFKLL